VAGRGEAFGGLRIEPVRIALGRARAAGGLAVEGDRHAIATEPRLEADRRLRPVTVLAHILLAAPDQLHRLAHALAHLHRLHQLVVAQAPAEAAAREAIVHIDI